MVLLKYNCQPRGYISKGERTIDNQSEQAATFAHDYKQSNSATIYTDWTQQTQNGHKHSSIGIV